MTVLHTFILAAFAAALPAMGQQIDLSRVELLKIIPIYADMDHVQGIDIEEDRLWITSVDRANKTGLLHLIELPSGRLLRQTEVHEGDRYHPGGISLDGDSVWIPVAAYRPRSSALIQRRQKETLELLSQFEVPDHIGCIAAQGGRLLGGNWDSERLYEWTPEGKQVSVTDKRTKTSYQDLKLQGRFLVASGNRSRQEGAIDWLHPKSFQLEKRIVAGKTDRDVLFTNEGMTVVDGRLYLLPEDGPSRLFVFQLPPDFNPSLARGSRSRPDSTLEQ